MAELTSCAPIALFVYNRPWHTRQTLESLAANPLAADSVLYVYADGPRPGEDPQPIAEVRATVRERAWCGEVRLIEAETNRGLASSIVEGVTERLREAESVIVLEDDLVLAPGFLAYMNRALALYREVPEVMQVAGFLPELEMELPATFFLRTASSWGWATWRRAWAHLRMDAAALIRDIEQAGRKREFNLDGGYDFLTQLDLNARGELRTWAIFFYASIFLAEGLVLHPGRSLVRNVGHDGSGTHCQLDARFEVASLGGELAVERVPVIAQAAARAAMSARYRRLQPRRSWWRRLLGGS